VAEVYTFFLTVCCGVGVDVGLLPPTLRFFEPKKVWQIPEFWVCTGILFFFAGTFFQMGLHSFLFRTNRELANRLYVINHLLNILLYGLLTVGFLCKASQKKLSSSS